MPNGIRRNSRSNLTYAQGTWTITTGPLTLTTRVADEAAWWWMSSAEGMDRARDDVMQVWLADQ